MRTRYRLATLGAGTALAVAGITTGSADAASPQAVSPPAVSPHAAVCTLTVSAPATYYASDSFSTPLGGKHTGDRVTSAESCATYSHGFHPLISSKGTVYMYTTKLVNPTPRMPVLCRYTVAGYDKVRTAPNPSYGTTIGSKDRGDVVSSPWRCGYFPNDFAQVILGNGNSAWMNANYLR